MFDVWSPLKCVGFFACWHRKAPRIVSKNTDALCCKSTVDQSESQSTSGWLKSPTISTCVLSWLSSTMDWFSLVSFSLLPFGRPVQCCHQKFLTISYGNLNPHTFCTVLPLLALRLCKLLCTHECFFIYTTTPLCILDLSCVLDFFFFFFFSECWQSTLFDFFPLHVCYHHKYWPQQSNPIFSQDNPPYDDVPSNQV